MGSRRRALRRTWITLAAITGLHAALFLLLASALAPGPAPVGREEAMVPIYLARLEPRRTKPREVAAPRRTPLRARIAPALATPELAAAPMPAPLVLPAESRDEAAERARLAGALRASRVGCANPALLSERERLRCEDRLAAGATAEKYIPTPLPKARRAYYDAVAKAKQPFYVEPRRPGETLVPPPRAGASTSLAALQAKNEKFNIPLVSCHIRLGPGGGVEHPAHTLKLGRLPCVIAPPQGPLTVEVGIRNPDTVVKGKN